MGMELRLERKVDAPDAKDVWSTSVAGEWWWRWEVEMGLLNGSVDDLSGWSVDVGGWGWVAGDDSSGHVLGGPVLEK